MIMKSLSASVTFVDLTYTTDDIKSNMLSAGVNTRNLPCHRCVIADSKKQLAASIETVHPQCTSYTNDDSKTLSASVKDVHPLCTSYTNDAIIIC